MKIQLPEDPKLAGQVLDAEAKNTARRMEIGWMGHIFGSGREKPGNIALTVILVSFALLAFVLFYSFPDPTVPRREIVSLLASIITGALGFVFGQKSSG